jgi:molecular chaperone HscB
MYRDPHRHTRFLRQAARNREYELIPHRHHAASNTVDSHVDVDVSKFDSAKQSMSNQFMQVNQSRTNYFALFNLEPCFALATERLENAYRALVSRVHPDRFTHTDAAMQRAAMESAANANEAYRTLKKPVLRAQHLLGLHGVITSDRSTTMSPAFLMEQMEWREALNEARSGSDLPALQRLTSQVRQRIQSLQAQLEAQLDQQHDHASAADSVNQLMFTEKLAVDIDDACAQLEE